jgi:hypothetical protein
MPPLLTINNSSEELIAFAPLADGVTFDLVMNWGATVERLTRARDDGEVFQHVVIIMPDATAWELLYARVVSVSIGSPPTTAAVQLQAEEAGSS